MASVISTDNRIEIKGYPFQGHGIFKDYYTLFRGKGCVLNNTNRTMVGLYNSLVNFFTAHFILNYEFSDNASELKELVNYHHTQSLHVVSSSPAKREEAYSVITNTLSDTNKVLTFLSLKASASNVDNRDFLKNDLSIYRFLTSFPSDKSSSASILSEHLKEIIAISERMMMGGFLILLLPYKSDNLDIILSSVEAVAGSLHSVIYDGMVFFDPLKLPLWIFRKEDLNADIVMARTNMAKKRMRRHLKAFVDVVEELAPDVTLVGKMSSPPLSARVLKTKVTPSHDLIRLFEILKGNYSREIINIVLPYQVKYDNVLSSAISTASKSSLLPLLNEMLYDFALSIARNLQISVSAASSSTS